MMFQFLKCGWLTSFDVVQMVDSFIEFIEKSDLGAEGSHLGEARAAPEKHCPTHGQVGRGPSVAHPESQSCGGHADVAERVAFPVPYIRTHV